MDNRHMLEHLLGKEPVFSEVDLLKAAQKLPFFFSEPVIVPSLLTRATDAEEVSVELRLRHSIQLGLDERARA